VKNAAHEIKKAVADGTMSLSTADKATTAAKKTQSAKKEKSPKLCPHCGEEI
jgi:hypothetical protein